MDLDLITNGSTIKNNLTSLNTGKISWIVLGYVNNKILSVIEVGDNSFEDMFEEFDSNKIMYGFAAVVDPNTKLKKNVFIHWQGEAATQTMKTSSVQHASIIRDLCRPVHVTHNARDEQDLDLNEIMTKVASASGANYSCHVETKQVFQQPTPVKSEENSAANARQTRLKELSSLGSMQKETFSPQKIGSTYEKVDAMNEIKNLRTKKFEGTPSPKPLVGTKYTKIDAAKEIKSSYNTNSNNVTRGPQPYKGVGKFETSKEVKSFTTNTSANQKSSSGYKKINPEQELRSLNLLNNKTMFENQAKVESENNTAQKAKEERQKELSNLFSKKTSYDNDVDQKVGTNYTRVNPLADIRKLRSASISQDEEIISRPKGNYTKIDPNAEMQILRRMSSSEVNEPVSPGANYKKINPAEEIKKLKSQSTFSDVRSTNNSYRKINPLEEISSARKASIPTLQTESSQIEKAKWEAKPAEEKQTKTVSARKSFEIAHKANNDIHMPHKTNIPNTESPKTQEQVSIGPHHSVVPVRVVETPPVPSQYIPPVVDDVRVEPSLTKVQPDLTNSMKNTAKTLYRYCANDTDEISFDEGELIQEIEVIDENWWMGVNEAGNRGMFPSEYVIANDIEMPKEVHRVITPEPQGDVHGHNGTHDDDHKINEVDDVVFTKETPSHSEHADSFTVVAIYDYVANDSDEISFDVGEVIREVEQVDDGWWIGVNKDGFRGMFPSNFVEIASDDKVSQPIASKEVDLPVKKEDAWAATSTPNQGHSSGHDDAISAVDPLTGDSLTVKAIFEYIAQAEDEISFDIGDVICNVTEVDDGWWEGEDAAGQRGLFPSNYVEAI